MSLVYGYDRSEDTFFYLEIGGIEIKMTARQVEGLKRFLGNSNLSRLMSL